MTSAHGPLRMNSLAQRERKPVRPSSDFSPQLSISKPHIFAMASDPPSKRVKLNDESAPPSAFIESALSPSTATARHDEYVSAEPYKHCVVDSLFEDSLLKRVRDEVAMKPGDVEAGLGGLVGWGAKETDIYKVSRVVLRLLEGTHRRSNWSYSLRFCWTIPLRSTNRSISLRLQVSTSTKRVSTSSPPFKSSGTPSTLPTSANGSRRLPVAGPSVRKRSMEVSPGIPRGASSLGIRTDTSVLRQDQLTLSSPPPQLPPSPPRRRHLDTTHLVDPVPPFGGLGPLVGWRSRALPGAQDVCQGRPRPGRRRDSRHLAGRGRLGRGPDQGHSPTVGSVCVLRGPAGEELPFG